MKHIYFLFLMFITCNFSYAQFGTSYEQAQVILMTGDTLNGFGNVYSPKLRLKDNDKKNRKDYLFSEIKSVNFTVYGGKKKSEKKEIVLVPLFIAAEFGTKEKFILAELICDKEHIKVYGMYQEGGGVTMGAGPGGQVSTTNIDLGFNANAHGDYYCLFNNEKHAVLMFRNSSLKSFKALASECFNKCETLANKIKSGEFLRKDIIEIANFYNDNCK